MVNIEHLTIFVAAVEHGSFSAAAKALGRSVSGVSMCISNMEDDLGFALFDRSTKRPTLTSAGERLLIHAQTLLRQATRLEDVIAAVNDDVEESFTIGLGELVPIQLVEEQVAKTIRQFPNTKFNFQRGTRKQMDMLFVNDSLDVLIRAQGAGVDTDADFYQFVIADTVCVCSPDSELADMDEVDNETLIATRQLVCESMFDNPMLKIEAIVSNDVMLLSSMNDLIQFVEQDLGWAFVPKCQIEDRVNTGALTTFMPQFALSTRGIAFDLLIKQKAHTRPVATYFSGLFTNK